ncbi:MAG: RND transporter [Deltaproteobacteria bacterium]|jgi:hypothetical protein|nr:RND transporter [Deltaproteobacteria bacterium]
MLDFIDKFSYLHLIIFAVALGLAPFVPEPHLVEKIRMLTQGTLTKPIDIFDLLFHSIPLILIGIKLVKDFLL